MKNEKEMKIEQALEAIFNDPVFIDMMREMDKKDAVLENTKNN